MAARKNRLQHTDKTREKIKSGMLAKKLSDHVLGIVELSATQIKAAEILLKKSLPDLKQMEHIGNADNPIQTVTRVERVIVNTSDTNS